MSGISGDRADAHRAVQDTGGRNREARSFEAQNFEAQNFEALASSNERLVTVPAPRAADTRAGVESVGQWHARRGRCDMRQVVSAA